MNKKNEIRKEIIKTIIKPILKENNYTNKGVYFFKTSNLFTVEINIQSQKYYKEENTENFRVCYSLFYNELEEKLRGRYSFGGGFISNANSWIIINPSTDIANLKIWLEEELNIVFNKIKQLQDIDYLIEVWKKHEDSIQYAFLLKENRFDNYRFWIEKMEKYILKIDEELILLDQEKKNELKRKDSLDKELKLDGLRFVIQEKLRKKKSIQDLVINVNNI